tara:strand:+ start:26 stop:160 length:135 start_codon:yes stop_codon:yes gene_type:complete
VVQQVVQEDLVKAAAAVAAVVIENLREQLLVIQLHLEELLLQQQ